MKLDKLARQIRRDMLASPKKAAALGLMILVALYFWAPMAWGWIAPGAGSGKRTVAANDVILEDDPVDPAAPSKQIARAFHWEKVRRQMAADPRTLPAKFDVAWTNPFPAAQPATGQQKPEAGAALVAATPELEPAAVGLKLESVVMGSRRRSATISGDSYLEGERIVVATENQTDPAIEFVLVRVGYREVELEREGRVYTLQLPRPKLSRGDEFELGRQE